MNESTQDIVNKLSKQKLLAYFLLLWGASFFLSAVDGFAYITLHVSTYYPFDLALDFLENLASFAIAVVLALLGWKFLKTAEK